MTYNGNLQVLYALVYAWMVTVSIDGYVVAVKPAIGRMKLLLTETDQRDVHHAPS